MAMMRLCKPEAILNTWRRAAASISKIIVKMRQGYLVKV
jgi:hypothetical protein